jgi:hypothetical protein
MSFGIAPGGEAFGIVIAESGEERRRNAHRDYARDYSSWIHSLQEEAEAGNRSAGVELNKLEALKLLKPLPYDRPARRTNNDDDNEFGDPADLAVEPVDPRDSIVDFESVNGSELEQLCEHFGTALVWATTKGKNGTQPDLMQMGARWLAIFTVMQPELIGEMNLRLPASMISELRETLNGRDPLETGRFFLKPLFWVRRCTSLLQLGKRAYSATYVLRGDLIDSATCAEIGGLDNKSRQAANKPIQEFRDTFGGIKSLPMRGKGTRKKCKQAQEKN